MSALPTDAEILDVARQLGYDEIPRGQRARFAQVAVEMRQEVAQPDPSAPIFHHEQNTPGGMLVIEAWIRPHDEGEPHP